MKARSKRTRGAPSLRRSADDYASEVFAFVSEKTQDETRAKSLVGQHEELIRKCHRAGVHPLATAGVLAQKAS